MLLYPILQARGGTGMVREKACQWALTRNGYSRGGGALEFGDLRLLEHGSERGGALGSDLVPTETANEGRSGNGGRASDSTGADTKANALVREGPAYSSDCSIELPLRPSARAAPPSGPNWLYRRLRARSRQVVRRVKGR